MTLRRQPDGSRVSNDDLARFIEMEGGEEQDSLEFHLCCMLDLRDARKELTELRAWREQVFLVVRQIESTLAEHYRIVESLKK